MLSGVRFSAQPAAPLQAHLRVWIGHQRHIKNCKVKERDEIRAQGASPLDDQKYAHLITEEKAFLKDVPSQILRNGAFRYMTGLQRFKKGVGGAPAVKKKFGRQSVLVTNELFRILAVPTTASSARHGWVIELGTKANPIGILPFHAHREFALPKQIVISIEPDGSWFVSFCYDKALPLDKNGQETVLRKPAELVYELQNLDASGGLEDRVWAGDRGITVPLAGSDGRHFRFSDVQTQRLAKAESNRKRYQRRMSRCVKHSQGYKRNKRLAANQTQYKANVREDFAHQTSHALVTSDFLAFGFEALKIANMTRAPKPKKDTQGRWTKNGSAAKAALSECLLASAWGKTERYTRQKATQHNKLVYGLNPAYSSQECGRCGFTHADNRKSQSLFRCGACGHTANADDNAAAVLKKRLLHEIRAGKTPVAKEKKRVALVKKALEQERLEVTSESGTRQSKVPELCSEPS